MKISLRSQLGLVYIWCSLCVCMWPSVCDFLIPLKKNEEIMNRSIRFNEKKVWRKRTIFHFFFLFLSSYRAQGIVCFSIIYRWIMLTIHRSHKQMKISCVFKHTHTLFNSVDVKGIKKYIYMCNTHCVYIIWLLEQCTRTVY